MFKVSFHIDLDSPVKLLDYYGLDSSDYTTEQLDEFYCTSMNRILNFLNKNNIYATFFVVGNDLRRSTELQKIIRNASIEGHEIGNHTDTHPFGLCKLKSNEIANEIIKCHETILSVTNTQAVGFRAPGYNVSTDVINILDQNGYLYDSSGFWSILNPIVKLYHKINSKNRNVYSGFGENSYRLPQNPYFPDINNWLKKTAYRKFVEIPLPTTKYKMPFYSNFHLMYPNYFFKKNRINIKRPYFVYLFHIIEFMDLTDSLPEELRVHPNLNIPFKIKINKLQIIVNTIKETHKCLLSSHYVRDMINRSIVEE